MDIHKYYSFMDINNLIMGIHNWIADIWNKFMDIHDYIMDIHNSCWFMDIYIDLWIFIIMDIHNSICGYS